MRYGIYEQKRPDALKNVSRWHSFTCAVRGVIYVVRTQPNAWIELAVAAIGVTAGILLRIQLLEWALLLLTIFLILALEAVNSAIEAAVDLASPRYHELARLAKDCAAGAMLLAVTGSLGVAVGIFGPRLWDLLALG